MPPPGGRIDLPARSRAFFGITHQFATNEATTGLGAGVTGKQDSVVLDGSYDTLLVGRVATWDAAAAGGQVKAMFVINRELQFAPGASAGATTPGVGGGSVYLSGLGRTRYPQYFRSPKFIRGGSTFTAVVDDRRTVQAGTVQIRFLHFGAADLRRVWAPRRWYADEQPYQYVADFTAEGPLGASVPANATRSIPITVDPDWDFEVTEVVILSDGEGKLQVKNIGLRTEWFNKAVHVWLLNGTTIDADPAAGDLPFKLPAMVTEFVAGTGGLLVTFQDLSGVANRAQVIFRGRKLLPPGGLRV